MTAPDIATRLHTMSGMLQMGDRIAYGSDAALMSAAADEIASLRAQLEAAQADAGRYRWLRENSTEYSITQKDGYGGRELLGWEALDAAVDGEIHKARGTK